MKGVTITSNIVSELLSKGESPFINGFLSKAGRKFGSRLMLQDGKILFKLPNYNEKPESYPPNIPYEKFNKPLTEYSFIDTPPQK